MKTTHNISSLFQREILEEKSMVSRTNPKPFTFIARAFVASEKIVVSCIMEAGFFCIQKE